MQYICLKQEAVKLVTDFADNLTPHGCRYQARIRVNLILFEMRKAVWEQFTCSITCPHYWSQTYNILRIAGFASARMVT